MFREMGLIMPTLFVSAVNNVIGTPQNSPRVLIIYWPIGGDNIATIANAIQSATGGDIYVINNNTALPNPTEYDIIFIGMSAPTKDIAESVRNFLSHSDFSGCVVIPFLTRSRHMRHLCKLSDLCQGCIIDSDIWASRHIRQRSLDKWVQRKLMLYN